MPLFLTVDDKLRVCLTEMPTRKKAKLDLEELQSGLVDFMAFRSNTADTVAALMGSGYIYADTIGHTLEEVMTEVYRRGVEYGRKHPK